MRSCSISCWRFETSVSCFAASALASSCSADNSNFKTSASCLDSVTYSSFNLLSRINSCSWMRWRDSVARSSSFNRCTSIDDSIASFSALWASLRSWWSDDTSFCRADTSSASLLFAVSKFSTERSNWDSVRLLSSSSSLTFDDWYLVSFKSVWSSSLSRSSDS